MEDDRTPGACESQITASAVPVTAVPHRIDCTTESFDAARRVIEEGEDQISSLEEAIKWPSALKDEKRRVV